MSSFFSFLLLVGRRGGRFPHVHAHSRPWEFSFSTAAGFSLTNAWCWFRWFRWFRFLSLLPLLLCGEAVSSDVNALRWISPPSVGEDASP